MATAPTYTTQPPTPTTYSEKDIMLAILGMMRVQNQLLAMQNGTMDELQSLYNDLALTFPLFNSMLIPIS